jgi:hypothetical protein
MQTLAHPSHRSPSNRFVCQQQRNEIMQHFQLSVNYFVSSLSENPAFNLLTSPFTIPPVLTLQHTLYLFFLLQRLPSFSTGGEL